MAEPNTDGLHDNVLSLNFFSVPDPIRNTKTLPKKAKRFPSPTALRYMNIFSFLSIPEVGEKQKV